MGRNYSDDSESPVKRNESPNRNRTAARIDRDRDRDRDRVRVRDRDRDRDNGSNRAALRSPNGREVSPRKRGTSWSPSPRTKRLSRAQADRDEVEQKANGRDRDGGEARRSERERVRDDNRTKSSGDKGTRRDWEVEEEYEREYERSRHRKDGDKYSRGERGSDREVGSGRKERSSGREETGGKSSRVIQGRSASPVDRHQRRKSRSRSPRTAGGYREHSEVENSRGSEHRNDDDDDSLAKMKAAEEALETKQQHQPSFELSGKLAAETNRFKGVTLLFNEPPEARRPDLRWRLYIFKGGEMLNEPLYIHRQSCYLFGRERRVADIPTDHPSCSKQHAVLQYRQVEREQPDGTLSKQVRPYLMDLGSTNKTFINDNPIEPQRYHELLEKDTIKFGNSSREYVLLHENSAG